MPRAFPKWATKIGHEVRELLPVWFFFFFAFSLLRLTQSVVLGEFGLSVTTPSLVLVGSLIIAKTFLLLDWFRFVERYNAGPLLISVAWKSMIYYAGAFLIFLLEQLAEFTLKHHDPEMAWSRLSTALGTPRFWIIQAWLVILLVSFTAVREMVRAIGHDKMMALWFRKRSQSS